MATENQTRVPTPLDWGRYKAENLTYETLIFLHPSYVLWILRSFPEDDSERQLFEAILAEANRRPTVITCDRQVIDRRDCDAPATHLSVAGEGSLTDISGALHVCSSNDCHRAFKDNSLGGINIYHLNFDGLKELARTGVPNHVLELFVRRLARAWGILQPGGKLTQENIHKFFYGTQNG